jgi:hypothetical protein
MGQYKRRARFGACGSFSQPGFLAEFRMLACAPLRVERAGLNENLSGRAVGSYRAPSVPPPAPDSVPGQLDFSSSLNSALLLLLDDI